MADNKMKDKKDDEFDDRLAKLNKMLSRKNSDNDSDDDSSNGSDSNNTGSNSSGGGGGGRGAKITASDDSSAGNQQESLVIGSDNYEQYVHALEADKICTTVDNIASKSLVYNKTRDAKAIDAKGEQNGRNRTDKSEQAVRTESRKVAYVTKKISRVNYEINMTTATAQRNFLRYRSKASVCGFNESFSAETRDFGVSKDQFIKRHDRDGNGKITREDVYLEKNDVNHDGCVDEFDKGQINVQIEK